MAKYLSSRHSSTGRFAAGIGMSHAYRARGSRARYRPARSAGAARIGVVAAPIPTFPLTRGKELYSGEGNQYVERHAHTGRAAQQVEQDALIDQRLQAEVDLAEADAEFARDLALADRGVVLDQAQDVVARFVGESKGHGGIRSSGERMRP